MENNLNKNAFKLVAAFVNMRKKLDFNLSLNQLLILLTIKQHNNRADTPTILQVLDISGPALSRHIKILGEYVNKQGENEGLNLVYALQNKREKRRFDYALTTEGEAFINQVLEDIYKENIQEGV